MKFISLFLLSINICYSQLEYIPDYDNIIVTMTKQDSLIFKLKFTSNTLKVKGNNSSSNYVKLTKKFILSLDIPSEYATTADIGKTCDFKAIGLQAVKNNFFSFIVWISHKSYPEYDEQFLVTINKQKKIVSQMLVQGQIGGGDMGDKENLIPNVGEILFIEYESDFKKDTIFRTGTHHILVHKTNKEHIEKRVEKYVLNNKGEIVRFFSTDSKLIQGVLNYKR